MQHNLMIASELPKQATGHRAERVSGEKWVAIRGGPLVQNPRRSCSL